MREYEAMKVFEKDLGDRKLYWDQIPALLFTTVND